MKTAKNNVYTVSRLNSEVRQLLEGELGTVWLNGEVSNFASPSSGHWYLTLKDHSAQIRCAMFKGRNRSVSFKPINGQQVLVKGAISVYEPRGDYQLILTAMQSAGDGVLSQQYEALKLKLAAEGLFAHDTKRPLPDTITRIGVVTSPTGAAIRDVLHVLARRDPSIEVIIYPTQVQGDGAEQHICKAIERANLRQEVDVLLLTRGGGSLEDMWCFNSETLAHHIYNSAIPVISAVGHEVDTCICDYVADMRAPTPSAGAELLSKDALNKREKLDTTQARLLQSWHHYRLKLSQAAKSIEHRLERQDPKRRLEQYSQRFDELQLRLSNILQQRLQRAKLQQQSLTHRLEQQSPNHRIALETSKLNYLSSKLNDAIDSALKQRMNQLQTLGVQLDTVSPLATLSRGYSITQNKSGKVLTNTRNIKSGDLLTTKLLEGEVQSKVI